MAQDTDTSARNTLIAAIAVSVLLVASIAVAAVRGPADEPVGQATGESTMTGEQSGATGTPDNGTPGEPGDTSGGGQTAPGTTQDPTDDEGKNLPSGNRAGAPTAPAPEGSRLTTLPAPPLKTIGLIKLPDNFKGATYAITFEPYGWGPSGVQGGRLVARIKTSKAADDGAKALNRDFTDRNATLWCTPEVARIVKIGGEYQAKLVVRPQGDAGVLYIENVKAVE